MYTTEQICTIVAGQWLQKGSEATIEYLLTDSRKSVMAAHALFFALKGPRRNGHSYIPELHNKGIRNFVVSEPPSELVLQDVNIILVKDPLAALQELAAFHRRQFNIPVIGITGSNGKTIVKEWLNQALEQDFAVVRSPRSYNSQLGVPLSVWQMNAHHTIGIFEAGISQPGEMERLEHIILPGIGILTNIGEAHSEGFSSKKDKLHEKLRLFAHSKSIIYCSDDAMVRQGIHSLLEDRTSIGEPLPLLFNWGKNENATVRLVAINKNGGTASIRIIFKGEEQVFTIPFEDDASIENAMHCYCTLLHLGRPQELICANMSRLAAVAMRLELKTGHNNCSIINDSYSADLSSLHIALDFLDRQQQHLKKTVILSDIPESGKSGNALYHEVAKALSEKNISRFIGIGPQLMRYQSIFANAGEFEKVFYTGVDAFRNDFYHLKFQHETILLKGARSFEFEQLLPLFEQQFHETVLEINLGDILHNLQQYQRVIGRSTRVMAMVKASAYGSGSYEIASLLQFHKIDYLAVAYADEGVSLRKGGISLPIMVMNPEPASFQAIIQFDLEPDIYSFGLLDAFEEQLKKEGLENYPVHIEIETGMNRLGFNVEDVPALARRLQKGSFRVQSVFTHLAASDDPASDDFTREQASKYFSAAAQLRETLGYPFIRHVANSAAILRYPELQLDMVRLGIGLYGIDSANTHHLSLREISTLKATVAQVKYLKMGETAGYGRKGRVLRDSVIATVGLGYADGYPRSLSYGIGKMLVNGQRAPVLGTVCMDMTMLDVTDVGPVKEGDEVIVYGGGISIQEVATWASLIPYEMMTGISQRVKRVYFEE